MDLRCPKCNSSDLKKVSLAYQEGLFRTDARTRIRGVLVGSNGPNLLVGGAATSGIQQSALSERLRPPKKWSYFKLVTWFALASFVGLVVYIHAVMASSSTASSLPVKVCALICSFLFVSAGVLTRRHNHSIYPRQYAHWDRSFVCQRCGGVNEPHQFS